MVGVGGAGRCLDGSSYSIQYKYLSNKCVQWLIHISADGLRYGLGLEFLSCTEIGSKDPSLSLCNVNMFSKYNVAIGFGV